MKKVLTIAAVVAALALTGCSSPMSSEQYSDYVEDALVETEVELSDGRTATCIVFSNREGISCDWENAN